MHLLVVGAAYRHTRPVWPNRRTPRAEETTTPLRALLGRPSVAEAMVLGTPDGFEVYAVVDRLRPGLGDIRSVLTAHRDAIGDVSIRFVHHGDAAVTHVRTRIADRDATAVGEPTIVEQARAAYRTAAVHGGIGPHLRDIMQQVWQTGWRTRPDTFVGRLGGDPLTVAFAVPAAHLPGGIAGRPALVIGAGAVGGRAVASLTRAGADPITVVNDGTDRRRRLVPAYDGTPMPPADLASALAAADVVVCATTSSRTLLTPRVVAAALRHRETSRPGLPLFVLDLAVPRAVDPAVGRLLGVVVVHAEARCGEPDQRDSAEAPRIPAADHDVSVGRLRGAEAA